MAINNTNNGTILNGNDDYSKLKQQLIQEFQNHEIKKNNFPTEVVNLPSKGLVYPENSPLRVGYIEMRYMTAKDEEILITPSYMKNNIVLDKLFQSLIVSPIKYNDLIEADKDAIMIAARMLGYGYEYPTNVTCLECFEESEYTFDLRTLKDNIFDIDKLTVVDVNEFSYTLPITGRVITFKFLTHGDQQKIKLYLDSITKKNPEGTSRELTTKYKHMILSIDGDYTKESIDNFVDNEFFAKDSKAFREYLKSVTPSVNYNVDFVCPHCKTESVMKLPMGIDFFWSRA